MEIKNSEIEDTDSASEPQELIARTKVGNLDDDY